MSPSDEQCVRLCLNEHPEMFRLLVELLPDPLDQVPIQTPGQCGPSDRSRPGSIRKGILRLEQTPEARGVFLLAAGDRRAGCAGSSPGRETLSCRRLGASRSRRADQPDRTRRHAGERGRGPVAGELPRSHRTAILRRAIVCGNQRHLGVPLGTVTKRLSMAYSLLRQSLRAQIPHEKEEAPR